ncbi:MAG: Dyp-type peroxidase [Thermoleophilia bacterium]
MPGTEAGTGFTRRRRLALGGGGALGLAFAGRASAAAPAAEAAVPFHGARQPGILTAPPGRLAFAAFDLTPQGSRDLETLLRDWTAAAERLMAGRVVGVPASPAAAPPDPGEAVGLAPAHLTITIGLGPGAFARGTGRAGLHPAGLEPLPVFQGDRLDPARSGGDLCVQACADDAQVAFHAVHALAHLGRGAVTMRWLQTGFTRSHSGRGPHPTPRNLQGFRDGTANIAPTEAAALRRHVWVGPEGPRWLRGGTYLVARRIRIHMERWDATPLSQQEGVIGRRKDTGAPLTGVHERDVPDFSAKNGQSFLPVIPMSAHIRQAHPVNNRGVRMLRRGYSFADGADPGTGDLDAGLFFIAFVRDPFRQFVPVQARLAASDALNDFIQHRSSAVFAVPPGVSPGGVVGGGLFA